MADNRPQPMQSPPLQNFPGAFSDTPDSEEELDENGEPIEEDQESSEGADEEEIENEEEEEDEYLTSPEGLGYGPLTPGRTGLIAAFQQRRQEVGGFAQMVQTLEASQEAEEEESNQQGDDPIQVKKDMMLEFVILGLAGLKDAIDATFAGFDLYIIGSFFGIAFAIWIMIVRKMQRSRSKNRLSNTVVGLLLFLECIPILCVVPSSLGFYYIVFKIDKIYEQKRKMEKVLKGGGAGGAGIPGV